MPNFPEVGINVKHARFLRMDIYSHVDCVKKLDQTKMKIIIGNTYCK